MNTATYEFWRFMITLWRKATLRNTRGWLFLEDVQEGFDKDGLRADADLEVFMSVVNALAKAPSLAELGDLLRKSAGA